MTRAISILGLMVILFAGCGRQKSNVNYTLTDDQLAHLMFDLQFSEVALAEVSGGKQDSLKDIFWLRYTEIYKQPKADLEEEIRKLETDPEKLKVIMERVQVLSDSLR